MNTEKANMNYLFVALLTFIVFLIALDTHREGVAVLFGCWSAFNWIAFAILGIRDIRKFIRNRKERRA